jgi:Bifunctional DNA primase/polymerase, N-terminal
VNGSSAADDARGRRRSTAMVVALDYAARNVPVHPVDPVTKRPLTQHGVTDATVDPLIIKAWATKWPDAGVAVATGTRSGIVVVDVDPRNDGERGIAEATAALGALPSTLMVTTPSGGWHYWLRLPDGVVLCNSVGALAEGVDVRGDGGYVVAPPTRRVSGGAWAWAGIWRSSFAMGPLARSMPCMSPIATRCLACSTGLRATPSSLLSCSRTFDARSCGRALRAR